MVFHSVGISILVILLSPFLSINLGIYTFLTCITYVLLIKEVILCIFVCTPHVLKERGYVPLPVIHYIETSPEQLDNIANRKSQLNNLHKLTVQSFQRLSQEFSIPCECVVESHISRQKLHGSTFYFFVSYWKWREMGEIARDTQLSQSRAKEKKTAVARRGRITCPLLPARIQKTYQEKSQCQQRVRSQYGEARVPGRPSTRPEQECVAVRDFVRPLRRAASHSSRSRLLHMNFAVLLARLGAARLPWAAAISRRPSTAATWPDLLADLCLPTFISNHHQLQSQSTRPGKIPIVFST